MAAVDGVSFSVEKGEVLGFLGRNGAGKSTTMKVIAGVLAPSSGTAFVGGEDVRSSPVAAKRKMGYLPEGSPLYGDMTTLAFLDFVARARLMASATRRIAVREVMERLGLEEMRHRRIDTLSKGYRRRVGLAQAIVHDPEVLVLDEPTDGLDPIQKHDVRELIRAMGGSKAIIVSTHILDEVDTVCDRAIIIDRGRIVIDETPARLYARSPDQTAVAMTLAGSDVERAIAVLRNVAGVDTIVVTDSPPDGSAIVVRPTPGRFIAEGVAQAVNEHHLAVTDMHGAIVRLDDVFRSVTAKNAQRAAR